jgi:UDP-N-acetylmuramoylalanine--D-glutamate ligase
MKIALLGYGKTTKAISKNYKCNIFDDNIKEHFKDENGNNIYPSKEFKNIKSDIQIPSPGIPPNSDLIKQSNNIMSDYDFFDNQAPLKIWISGTNGKTTLTQMIECLIKDRGAISGGNIGTPIASMDKNKKIWILETSSFTLHYTNKARANIYILLPITSDHLNWHGDFKKYEQAKLKPLSMMEEGETAIIPKKYKNIKTNAHIITYENSEELARYFDIDINKIKFKEPFLLDALLAMAVEQILFFNLSYDKINNFKIDAHKIEELRDNKNRLWVNDSKATNMDASLQAIQRYKDKKIHLILGGNNKGVDLEPLIDKIKDYNIIIYAIGKAKDMIMTLSNKYNIKCVSCGHLEYAINEIKKYLDDESVALLSPSCSSLDQFDSYAKRGDFFKESIKQ